MQLSARILTALAVLALTVAVVAGRGVTDEVSAATGTIDAMNVGACTTTNSDALGISDCKIDTEGAEGDGNTKAFFEQVDLEEAIEVDELYATYAHDPKTAAEAPRGIVANGDLIKISIKDSGRDRRDPVLIAIENGGTEIVSETAGGTPDVFVDVDDTDVDVFRLEDEYSDGTSDGGSLKIVADSVGVESDEIADLSLETPFISDTNYTASGSYTVVFNANSGEFKPIAPNGKVKFFGRIDPGGTLDGDYSAFMDIGANVKLDEDVISGENGTPAMVVNVNVPAAANADVDLQVIYYETSSVEVLQGGTMYCTGSSGGVNSDGDCPEGESANEDVDDVVYTSDEQRRNTALLVQATSDGNDADAKLYLEETGRFDGVYEGFLRLTDADGDGTVGEGMDNWGEDIRQNDEEDDGDDGDATDADVAGSAILGVGNGPVVVRYRDSNGNVQSFSIQIDIEPPVINIDSPVNDSRSDDEKPSFLGTFNDGDAGLAANTFQLYVDNDPTEGTGTGHVPLLSKIEAAVTGSDDGIDRRLEYEGYTADAPKYGVVGAEEWQIDDAADPNKQFKSVEADDYANGAPSGEFADEVEIDFDEKADTSEDDKIFNHAIEFQALVRDLAGNVGFSDSNLAKPRFINDLGEKKDDGRSGGHNVLGVFSHHVVYLDEVDPYILEESTVTGFYGLDDDKPIRDRSSVMVVFDNAVEGSLIDSGTFTLEDDDGNSIAIADVMVKGKLVFLKLDEELASDARPMLSITEGREVEDKAGNILGSSEHILRSDTGDRVSSIKVRDGILPVFTLTLSNGSGTGVGHESSAQLTKEAIDIAIESDEDISGAPRVAVVCSNIGWTEGEGDDAEDKELSDYVSNRTGYDAEPVAAEDDAKCGGADEPSDFIESSSLSRPGNNWVYSWRSPSGATSKLPDGGITVVVWARDRGEFTYYKSSDAPCRTDDSCDNYGSETATFTLDTTFNSPLNTDGSGGDVEPDPGTDVAEARPFVLLDFAGERTNVSVTKLMVDGTDVLGSLDDIGENRFLYWPEALDYGEHTVEFDARDAADNAPSGGKKFTFNVTQRDPFVLDISAGWNAISFPANPVDTALDAVFTDDAIDRVVGWNPMNSAGAWSIASRVDGVWTTSMDFAPLTDVAVRYGYWVHSMAFIKQNVDLEGPINRETSGNPHPIGIQTIPGWNFIGVVDQDGDQTEDHFDNVLQDSEDVDVLAKDYMPGYRRAYTWDAIANGYRVLEEDDPMKIGKGIWVFFPDDDTIAP